MATSTAAAIRDRIATVIRGLSPSVMADQGFVDYRHEYDGDFRDYAKMSAGSILRRFSVRQIGTDILSAGSTNHTDEGREVTFEVSVGYPKTHRYGDQGALDRDDVITSDYHQIDFAIGMAGRANFPSGSAHDCAWVRQTTEEIERGDESVDILVWQVTYHFYLSRS